MYVIRITAIRPLVTNILAATVVAGLSTVASAQQAATSDDAFAAMLEAMSPDMIENNLETNTTNSAISQLPQFVESDCVLASGDKGEGPLNIASDNTYALISECFNAEVETSLVGFTTNTNG